MKYPNIQFSNKDTRIHQGVFYNWGVKPVDLGGSITRIDPNIPVYGYFYADAVSVTTPLVYENGSDEAGNIVRSTLQSGIQSYFVTQTTLTKKRFEPVSGLVGQPMPGRGKATAAISSQVVTEFCNLSDMRRSVTTGIKTYSRSPQIVTEETFDLNPRECKKAIVSDSYRQPLIAEEGNPYTKQPDGYYLHINPTREEGDAFNDVKKGIYYYRINSELPVLRYYQRSILLGIHNASKVGRTG